VSLVPVDGLHHVSVVVRDLRAAARSYAEVYGIERWDVVRHTEDRLSDTAAFGYETRFTYATATGSNAHGVTFRLVQPEEGLSTYAHFLTTRGEGIHGLCLARVEERAFADVRPELREQGILIGQAATLDRAVRHYHLDTRAALGGFFVEVVVPLAEGGGDAVRVDERWDVGDQVRRPEGVEPLQDVRRISHFGVAVNDLMARLPAYASVLGLSQWSIRHFRTGPGSLEATTVDGEEVEHAFLLALAGVEDVGFEIIQPTREPTHYRRHLLDPIGEGVHHLLLLPGQDGGRWPAVRAWMEDLGAPVAMSGRVGATGASYSYLDTRAKLGGYLVEAIVRPQEESGEAPQRSEPDYTFDFGTQAPE
jgi:catechol 2,3-dioxygenase-like lactoylglutathione lyase family enzyme